MRPWFIIIYEPENKAQSRQSEGPGSPMPKKFKTQPSAGKAMATVTYNNWSVLSKGILPQQDNTRDHTCKVAMDAVERHGYELIPHPAYSPDQAPSDFFLFPDL